MWVIRQNQSRVRKILFVTSNRMFVRSDGGTVKGFMP